MVEIKSWLEGFITALEETFGDRVWFVGLQGSYGRGEASEKSDIDTVVILDALTVEDIKKYDEMLNTLPHRELVCGFLSGKDEILAWESSDLFQFYHDTVAIRGSLDGLLPLLDKESVQRAVKIGACNIYHGCVHNMLHEKSGEILRGLYKSASFVLQATAYLNTGRYYKNQKALSEAVSAEEREIVNTVSAIKNGEPVDLEKASQILFEWSKNMIIHF